MKFKLYTTILLLFCIPSVDCYSQSTEDIISISSETCVPFIHKNFPAFVAICNYYKSTDNALKGIYFCDFSFLKGNEEKYSFYKDKKYIFIDQGAMIKTNSQEYTNRVLWSFFINLGNIHYWQLTDKWEVFPNEKYKFTFAIKKAYELAKNGNCEVLKIGISELKNLYSKSKIEDQKSAISEILNSADFLEYDNVAKGCDIEIQSNSSQNENENTISTNSSQIDSQSEDKIFNKVEVEASFPGGDAAWIRFLKNNLDPSIPIRNGAPAGSYLVIVRFIVSKDGSISNVVPETNHGYGMETEAVRVIKNGPKWTPALLNGRNVNAYRRQPMTFLISQN